MALATDPWVPGASGIGEKALRIFDPAAAKGDKDRKHREAAREKMAREFQRVDALRGAVYSQISERFSRVAMAI